MVSTPFFTAKAFDEPWPTSSAPFTPRSGAPPYVSGLTCAMSSFRPPLMARAPSFVTGVFIITPLSVLNSVLDVPSMVLRHTLPVKPSVTMTSNFAGRMSPPSALPAKFGSCSFSSA